MKALAKLKAEPGIWMTQSVKPKVGHNDLLIKIIPVTNNAVIRMILKAIFFMIAFYLVQNFWLIKKKN